MMVQMGSALTSDGWSEATIYGGVGVRGANALEARGCHEVGEAGFDAPDTLGWSSGAV